MRIYIVLLMFFIFNSVLYAKNPMGKALLMDNEWSYFEIPDAGELNLGKDKELTVEFRFKRNSESQCALLNKFDAVKYNGSISGVHENGWYYTLNRVAMADDLLDYVLLTESNFDPGTIIKTVPGKICFLAKHGINHQLNGCGTVQTSDPEKWAHMAFVFDFDKCFLKSYVFKNGSLDFSKSGSFYDCDLTTFDTSLKIGGFGPVVDSLIKVNEFNFDGYLDEVRIWTKARSEKQIRMTMNDTLGPAYYQTPDSGLYAYYRFDAAENLGVMDDGRVNDIRDLSHNRNHGSIYGNFAIKDVAYEEITFLTDSESAANKAVYEEPVLAEVKFQLRIPQNVSLYVMDGKGNLLETETKTMLSAGEHSFRIDMRDKLNGNYYFLLKGKDFSVMDRLVTEKTYVY